jgi:hypothetical protein
VVHTDRGVKRRVLYGKTRKEVADKLVKTLADRADGLVYDDENTTLGDYLDAWLKGSVRGSVRESTFDRYETAVRVHIKPALGRGLREWAMLGSNQRPLPCEGESARSPGFTPVHQSPGTRSSRARRT